MINSGLLMDFNLMAIFIIGLLIVVGLCAIALVFLSIAYNVNAKVLYGENQKTENEKAELIKQNESIREALQKKERECFEYAQVITSDSPFVEMLMKYELYDSCSPLVYMMLNKICFEFSKGKEDIFIESIDDAITYLKSIPVSKEMLKYYVMVNECYMKLPTSKRNLKNNDIKEIHSMIYRAQHDVNTENK